MITINTGITKIEGSQKDIMADLSTAVSELKEVLMKMMGINENTAEDKILLAVERGFLLTKKMDSTIAYEVHKLSETINGGN